LIEKCNEAKKKGKDMIEEDMPEEVRVTPYTVINYQCRI